MAVCKRYRYTVSGVGSLPMDMLRYDKAYPFDQAAAAIIHDSFESPLVTRLRASDGVWIIELESHFAPTPARWSSFGWHLTNLEESRR